VPLYEYECTKCGKRTEKIERASGPHLKKCPHCGGRVERLIGAPAIQFKGSGWYATDYADKKSATNETAPAENKATTEGTRETAKEATKEPTKEPAAKETKEKKPAKK